MTRIPGLLAGGGGGLSDLFSLECVKEAMDCLDYDSRQGALILATGGELSAAFRTGLRLTPGEPTSLTNTNADSMRCFRQLHLSASF